MALPTRQPGRDRPAGIVSPSILSADFANLAEECQRMIELGADWLHVDVMDGHFVPNLTIGAPVVKSLRKNLPASAFLDVHLMVSEPARWVDDFAAAGASLYTFHIEAVAPGEGQAAEEAVRGLVAAVRKSGMLAGIALKPGTPVEAVLPYAGDVDLVLVMTVEPGFGGQSFMPATMSKVAALRADFPDLNIQVDGGLAPSTIEAAAAAGANVIVAGSAVFGAADPGAVIKTLRHAVDRAAVQAAA